MELIPETLKHMINVNLAIILKRNKKAGGDKFLLTPQSPKELIRCCTLCSANRQLQGRTKKAGAWIGRRRCDNEASGCQIPDNGYLDLRGLTIDASALGTFDIRLDANTRAVDRDAQNYK